MSVTNQESSKQLKHMTQQAAGWHLVQNVPPDTKVLALLPEKRPVIQKVSILTT